MKDRIPSLSLKAVPAITTDQMREVDRLMVEDFGISLEQMMEQAGRNLADLAREFLADIGVPPGLYTRLGLPPQPWFADSPILRIAAEE